MNTTHECFVPPPCAQAQPVAAEPRATHPPGTMITLDSGLVIPQVPLTYAHAGSRPNWAHPYGGYSEGINEFGVSIGNEMFPAHHLPTDQGAKPQTECVSWQHHSPSLKTPCRRHRSCFKRAVCMRPKIHRPRPAGPRAVQDGGRGHHRFHRCGV